MGEDRRRQIVESLKDKEYRNLFVEANIRNGIAFQVRAMRQARGWTKGDMAKRMRRARSELKKLENPDDLYALPTLATLRALASVFDVALVVKFVPFSRLVDDVVNMQAGDLAVPGFDEDGGPKPD